MRFSFVLCFSSFLFFRTAFEIHAQIPLRQIPDVELSIEEIGVAQGLSQGMVHGMDVDLRGYLWVATKDGLNRYDGNHFHVFRNDPHDEASIASNYIINLHVDDRGLIWVGTNASGLDLHNPSTSGFIHFGKESNPASVSTIQSISKIFSDPHGNILIMDASGKQSEILMPIA